MVLSCRCGEPSIDLCPAFDNRAGGKTWIVPAHARESARQNQRYCERTTVVGIPDFCRADS